MLEQPPAGQTRQPPSAGRVYDTGVIFQAPGMTFFLHFDRHFSTSGLDIQHTSVSVTTEISRFSKEAAVLKIAMLS